MRTTARLGIPDWVGSLTALLLVVAAPEWATAQTRREAPAFTLSDAATLARRQHPLLSAAGGRRLAATGTARQEASLPNPTFEWRKENYGSPLPRDEFVSLGMPVDFYGRRMALRTAQGFVASRARLDSSTTARDVEYDVARAYWRTALAYALLDAAEVQRLAVDTIARIETERARQGQVSNGSALRARLEADRARLALSGARAEVSRARGDLARALATPFDSVPRPTDVLRVDSATAAVPPLDALLALARTRRSELLAARARVDETSRRQLAERLGTFPAFGAQVGNKRTSGFLTQTLQIGVAVPFFDRNSGNRERARGEVLMAEGDLRAAQASVDAEVMSAYRAYRALLDEYDRAGDIGLTAEGLRTLEQRGATVAGVAGVAYREGAISLFELLDAERVRADVRITALRAAADVQMARADLLRALGLPIDGTGFQLTTP
jgi:cobalt-zinc-cadmium efflux system outer membrane protein